MDKFKLLFEMKVRGISIKMMCKMLGISRSAFYRKCNGLSEFTQSEIQTMLDILNLETPVGIFFKNKVS